MAADYTQFQYSGNNVTIPGSFFQQNPNLASNYGGANSAAWQQMSQGGTTMPLGMAQSFGFLGNLTNQQAQNLGGLNSTGNNNGFVSSMLLPMYANYMSSMNSAQGQNQQMLPMMNNATQAAGQAAQSSIQSQVASGMQNLSQTQAGYQQQQDASLQSFQAERAAASGNFKGDTAATDMKAAIEGRFAQANATIAQAANLLQLQGTAAEQAANQQTAQGLLQNAQTVINNTMQLASSGLQAATQMAGVQLQAASFGLQQDQFNLGVQQYQDNLNKTNQQFAVANDIQTPYYTVGGQVYSTQNEQPIPQQQAQGIPQNMLTNVDGNRQLSQQLMTNYATAYPDAKIDPTKDTIATAQQKIKSSEIYKISLSNGIAGAAKPTGVLADLQKYTTLNNTQFSAANNIIQSYLSQHPTLWNMNNVDQATRDQSKQEVVNTFMQYSQSPGNALSGMPYSGIQALVDFYFSPNAYNALQQIKIDTSKPTASSLFQQSISGGGLQGSQGAAVPPADTGFDSATNNLLQGK